MDVVLDLHWLKSGQSGLPQAKPPFEFRAMLMHPLALDNLWIEDLRVFPHAVSCADKNVPHDIPLDDLTGIFGKCDRVPGLKGGIYFNCANGLSIGTDFSRKTLKIRVKPITASE
jgi:hypothetical protein